MNTIDNIIDLTISEYNHRGLFMFETAYGDSDKFSDFIEKRLLNSHGTLFKNGLRKISKGVYKIFIPILEEYSRNNRFSSINDVDKKDLSEKIYSRLEEKTLRLNIILSYS